MQKTSLSNGKCLVAQITEEFWQQLELLADSNAGVWVDDVLDGRPSGVEAGQQGRSGWAANWM